MIIVVYLMYLALCLLLTIWVAEALRNSGKAFLEDVFQGNQELAVSINHLLVVGFYLVSLGFVLQFMKSPARPEDVVAVFEILSTHLGTVLFVVGFMHFFNLLVLSRWRNSRLKELRKIEDEKYWKEQARGNKGDNTHLCPETI